MFKGLKLKDPKIKMTMKCTDIDGYYVNCVGADNVEYMKVTRTKEEEWTRRNKDNNTTERTFTKRKNTYT